MQFFSKITETISDTSKVVAQKAKDISDLTRLNSQISTEENRINAAFLAIGRRYFEENAGEVSEEYISDFSAINDARAKIRSYQDQISIIKGICTCQNCGTEVSNEAVFCSTCGAKLEKPEPKKEEKKEEESKKEEHESEINEAAKVIKQAAKAAKEATETFKQVMKDVKCSEAEDTATENKEETVDAEAEVSQETVNTVEENVENMDNTASEEADKNE